MKKRRNKFFDIRVQFFFICMAGFVVVALLALSLIHISEPTRPY